MKLFFTFSLSCLILGLSYAQAPSVQWQKTYGGIGDDILFDAIQTSDGGYVMIGNTNSKDGDVTTSFGNLDYLIIKVNSLGVIEWKKSYGGSGNEQPYSIIQTTDGGYIVGGYSDSKDGTVLENHGSADYWVLKLDVKGVIEWQKSYGGSDEDRLNRMKQTSDGGYILSGLSRSNDGDVTNNHGNYDAWIVKINSKGSIEWQKSIGGSDAENPYTIQQTSEGGYVFNGYTRSRDGDLKINKGDWDYMVVKINYAGTIEWQKTFGGSGVDASYCMQQTKDGGYIVGGRTESNDGDVSSYKSSGDFWVLKLSSAGTIEWQKTYGGSGEETINYIQQTKEGGYILGGYTLSNNGDVNGNNGNRDFWVVKINYAGTLEWQKCLGEAGEDVAYITKQTTDGGYISAGYTHPKIVGTFSPSGVKADADFWLVKLGTTTPVKELGINLEFKILPNPATNTLLVDFSNLQADELIITDVIGRNYFNQTIKKGEIEMQIDVSDLVNGVWFISLLKNGKNISNQKFIIQK